ncbi:aspartate/glutamate racemase family protein [Epibacterium ulvae]|uniref:maleate cis-trans isomerase family protein n=1 Tax=Epibacterium ulvae TaxID=1156985 RepID=UPI001BFC7D97|nr:aspartate/glutamate racemase family protein [Epibacterium ulvae]MBT8152667.1 aspartate/glutamate racemase family protein [Epibacterium ulvae]
MDAFPYALTGPMSERALGMVVLQTDETIEQDFRHLFTVDETLIYTSRVPSGETVSPETLSQMETALSDASDLLPKAARYDALAYCCTSGTAMIGAARVAELVSAPVGAVPVSTPLTAAVAALHALGVKRLGIVSPYVPSVAVPIRTAFETAGFVVPQAVSFGEEVEANVVRIAADSIRDAARVLAQENDLDALFLSCTNLRTLDVIDDLEAELGLPVVSSNQALAWHMAQLAGISRLETPVGRLLKEMPALGL